jgi:hypothetical protein
MSFDLVTEPIDRWPGPETDPRTGPPFKAAYSDTITLLTRELEHLGTKGRAVIQVVTRNGATDLRRDGLLRTQARIEHPGVRLSFACRHGDLTYATDEFEPQWRGQMPGWQANLRAIALSLEKLRAVDRYGVTKSGEQYTGWLAIEASPVSATTARDAAMATLRKYAPPTKLDEPLERLARWAKAGAHPDRHGGDQSHWDSVVAALEVLGWTSA